MVGPISVNGPASGIDTSGIIAKIISIQTAPERVYQSEVAFAQAQQNALLQVNVGLLAVKSATDQLRLPSLFASTKLSSSNEAALTASSTGTVAPGEYNFSVAKLAQANQLTSNGFGDSTSTPVTSVSANLSIEIGGGFLDRSTPVSFLNGQTGFDRGSIRVRDSSGASALIDLSGASSAQDIVQEINSAGAVSIKASLQGNRIMVEDVAGGSGTLSITDAGGTTTATSLGIAGTARVIGGNQLLLGSDINQVTNSTSLALLNGGMGVRTSGGGLPDFTISRGGSSPASFNVTLKPGDTTLGQVVAEINSAAGTSGIAASVDSQGNALVLTSSTVGGLTITPTNGSFAAVDLGLGSISGNTFVQNAVEDSTTGQASSTGDRLVGNSLTGSLDGIQRSLLNGGQTNFNVGDVKGVSDGVVTLTDRLNHSATVNVSSSIYTSAAIAASTGQTSLTVGSVDGFAVGNQFRVQTSTGVEYRTVTGLDAATKTITFDQALGGDVGLNEGVVALNGSLADMVRTLNQGIGAQNVGIQVGLNQAGNGLRVTDLTNGTASPLKVSGAPASDLGIAGQVSAPVLDGTSLHAQYIGDSTKLSSLNGGHGIDAGQFQVTDTTGHRFTISLSQPASGTIGSLIQNIDAVAAASGSNVTAGLNDTGNGIVLVDTTPGSGTLQVQDLNGGRTAHDLDLAGSALAGSPAQIDGSFQHQIAIAANSNLQSVADAINAQGLGVSASIINDGSANNAFHLVLTSQNSGVAGRLTVDGTIPGLSFATTTSAQDAVLVYGGGGGATPTVVTSSTNSIGGLVPGLNLHLNGVSSAPVAITAATDTTSLTTQIQNFVNSYNTVLGQIKSDTAFDTTTNTPGILFGNSALQEITSQLANLVTSPVLGVPQGHLNTLTAVGVTVGQQGTLSLDQNVLSNALSNNFSQVEDLFTQAKKLDTSTKLSAINSGAGITDTPGADFAVTAKDGTSFKVDIAGSKTLGDLLLNINNAPGNNGKVTAGISPDGFSLQLTDNTGASAQPLQVRDIGSANAASELKIATTAGAGETTLKGGLLTLRGSPGMGAQLSDALTFITEPGDGLLTTQTNELTTKIKDLNKSIANINNIASQMEISLVRQFAALEAIIASSETTSQELQAILGSGTTASSTNSLQNILGNNTAGGSGSGGGTGSTSSGNSGSAAGSGSTNSSGSSGSGG